MKNLLLLLCLMLSITSFSQKTKPNYTTPYFQASVKVADTLAVEGVILSDLFKSPGDSANIMFNGQEIRFTAGKFFVTPYFGSLAATSEATLLSFGTGTFSRVGEFGIVNNDNGNVSSLNADNFPAKASSRNLTINQDVVNTFLGGGTNIIAKTNNSVYANQYIFNSGEAFETILRYNTPTDERDIKLPDNSGTVALLSDIPSIYGAQGFNDSLLLLSMTQDNFTLITNDDNTLYTVGVVNGDITFQSDTVIVNVVGDYDVNYDISFSGANADEYHIAIFVNGVQQFGSGETVRDMVTTEIQPVTSHTILSLVANDCICIKIKNVNNDNDATLVGGNFTVKKL